MTDRHSDPAALTGVSETALLTLNGRAHQAEVPEAIISDPMAITLRDALAASSGVDYAKFGRRGQEMALRSLAVDRCTVEYLRSHPKATVVALAEGFQTSFWRIDAVVADPQFRWVSVDLPPVIELRGIGVRHGDHPHLRHLDLSFTRMRRVPPELGRLGALRFLRVCHDFLEMVGPRSAPGGRGPIAD